MKEFTDALYVPMMVIRDPGEPREPRIPSSPPPRVFARVFLDPVNSEHDIVVFAITTTRDDADDERVVSTVVSTKKRVGKKISGGSGFDASSSSVSKPSIEIEEILRVDNEMVVVVALRPSVEEDTENLDAYVERVAEYLSSEPDQKKTFDERRNALVVNLELFSRDLADETYADVVAKLFEKKDVAREIGEAIKLLSENIESLETLETLENIETTLDEWRRAFDLELVTIAMESPTDDENAVSATDDVAPPENAVSATDESMLAARQKRDAALNAALNQQREEFLIKQSESLRAFVDKARALEASNGSGQTRPGGESRNPVETGVAGRATENDGNRPQQPRQPQRPQQPQQPQPQQPQQPEQQQQPQQPEQSDTSPLPSEFMSLPSLSPSSFSSLLGNMSEGETDQMINTALEAAEQARLAEEAAEQARLEKNAKWEWISRQLRDDIAEYFREKRKEISGTDQMERFEQEREGLENFVKMTMDTNNDVWNADDVRHRDYDEKKTREVMLEKIRGMYEAVKQKWPTEPARVVEDEEVVNSEKESLGSLHSPTPEERRLQGGWNSVHAIAKNLDNAFGFVKSGSESARAPSRPVSRGPDSDLVWLNM